VQDVPLTTNRLVLEPLVVSHARALYPLLRDERLYTYIPQEPPPSIEAVATRYGRLEARHAPDGRQVWLNWVARLGAGESYVGTFEATLNADRTALLAYMIFPQYQGQGYAREGGERVLDHLVRDHGVRLVVAEIDTRNRASIGVVESLGFVRVAERPAADFFKGTVSDEYRYEYRPGLPWQHSSITQATPKDPARPSARGRPG
jgi:RimJ/RimL family protein N-acetyltransferase